MVKRTALWSFGILIGSLLIAMSCSRKPQQKPGPPPLQIGVSISSEDKALSQLMQKTMQSREKEEQARVVFKDAGGDPQKQRQDIEKMLQQKIKVLVAWFGEPTLGEEIAPSLAGKGIKLVAMQKLVPRTPLDGLVAVDPSRVGSLAGEFIAGGLRSGRVKGPKVLLLTRPDDPEAAGWQKGLQSALAGTGASLTMVQVKEKGTDLEGALEKLLSTGPGAVVTAEGALTSGLLKVLGRLGLEGSITTVGFGGGKEAASQIAGGTHDAEVDTNPELVARGAYEAALELGKGGNWKYETRVPVDGYDVPVRFIPARLITKENVYLLEARWGKPSGGGGNSGGGSKGSGGSGGSDKGSGGSSGSGGTAGGKGGGGSKVIVKTKDGKKLEMQVEGEIESIEVKKGQ